MSTLSTYGKKRSNRIIFALALIALLGLGVWLRVRFVRTVQLYPDEFVTLLAVRMIGQKGWPVMPSGLFFEHGLLFSYIGSLASFFGPARWSVRYASLVFGLLTLGLTFFAGRRWFSPAVGLIAVTGLVIAPTAIHWSGRARMYALLQLLVLLTLWPAYEGIVRDKVRWRWAALAAYLGATLTHFLAVALAPPLVLAAVALWWFKLDSESQGSRQSLAPRWIKRKELWLEILAFGVILIVAFLVKRAGQPKGIDPLETSQALSGLAQVLAIYSDISFNLRGGWRAIAPFYLTLPAVLFLPFIPFALLAGRRFFGNPERKKSGRAGGLLLTSKLPAFPASIFLMVILLTTTLEMIFLVSPDRRDDKYLFMLLPVLLLLGAQGMMVISGQVSVSSGQLFGRREQGTAKEKQLSQPETPGATLKVGHTTVLALLVSGLILTATRSAVHDLLANTGDDYDAAFGYVQAHWQPGDTILTGTPPAAAFYLGRNDFYSVQRRGGYDYRLLTVGRRQVDRWLASPAITSTLALHQTLSEQEVWLVLERWGLQREYYDLPFQQQLLAQTELITESQGIFVLRSQSEPQPLALEPAHPTTAVFGDQVRLVGYTIEPESPTPGQSLRLTLYWQALAPMSHDYTVFVHLRQPQGGNVAQADHRPLGTLYPTTLWPVDQTIRETSHLFLPPDLPPGRYDLWAGLYLLETGERLPVQNDSSGENAVRLGAVRVNEQ